MEIAAVYATKNSNEATIEYLDELMKEKGRGFEGEDFTIERDERNNVTISIIYEDEISIFGLRVKALEMTVERNASEVEAIF
jgi:hypothetical protein